ncbi:replication initiation protein [Campylobacter felis]|uniref:replication initiation protein n=1 Tax=Campylobacter felis TaxID=2974565 RepID=UPI0025623A6F|nr:replication initiation protein [Campylobacter felis]
MAKNTEIIELKEGFTRNQSNVGTAITHARTKMTSLELKTFYQVTTLIQKDDSEFKEYEISVSDFLKALNISNDNREQVIKLCKRLVRQVFEIEQANGDYIAYPIFSKMHYKHKEQVISMRFNDELAPFLLELKQFTKIHQIKYIKSFDSKYAIRFYTLLKDYRQMTYREFSVEALCKMLELPKSISDSYTRIYKYVIEPALREIDAKSDLEITNYEITKKLGKKITHFKISFKNKNSQMSEDFTKELIKRYKTTKSFNVFIHHYYLWNKEFKSMHDLAIIGKITLDNRGFLNAYDIHHRIIFSSPNNDDFLKTLTNGIYKAAEAIYEKEKKEQLPTMQWQDKKDKVARLKAILKEWEQKAHEKEKESFLSVI